MNDQLSYVGSLTICTCWCGMRHAVPAELLNEQRRLRDNGFCQKAIYCPLGHEWVSPGPSKVDELEKRIARERAAHDQTRAELRETEQRRRSEKGAKTRLANRVKNGVCPCCNRSFENLQRHMTSKHPTFAKDEK